MKKIPGVALLVFLGVFSLGGPVWADVAPRCKCEAAGAVAPGGMAAVMAVAGAGVLLALRGRKSSKS